MFSSVKSLGVSGIGGYGVSVEVYISNGLPHFDIVGLPDAAVKEARERVRASIKNIGMDFPVSVVTVNLAPADRKKAGTVYDLPILLGILIGVTLTIMFSLQGQRRLQTFLSPAMAVLAFLLLAFGKSIISTPWVREAVAFSMLGVVLMRSNRVDGQTKKEKKEKPVSTAGEASADDAW